EDLTEAGCAHFLDDLFRSIARSPKKPRTDPEQAAESEPDEKSSPSESDDRQTAHQVSDGRTALRTRVDPGVRNAAMALAVVAGDDLRVRRVGDRFPHSEQQPHDEERRKPAHQTGTS